MKTVTLSALLLTSTVLFSAAIDGEKLAQEQCTSCHLVSSNSDKLTNGKMGGPPMWGVMKKVKQHFDTKEEGIAFIIDYTMEPSKEKMLFPAATREYFGVMPALKGKITPEEMSAIAKYLYGSTRDASTY